MKTVFVCSPFGGNAENATLAKRLCASLVRYGFAPFAPHLLYPQFLNEANKRGRELGIECGLAWLDTCDMVFVYRGEITPGMQIEINRAKELQKTIHEICYDDDGFLVFNSSIVGEKHVSETDQ